MDDITLSLLFALGVIAEGILLCYHKNIEFKRLKGVFILTIVAMILSLCRFSPSAGLASFLFMFVIYFSAVSAFAFRDEILPVINEGTILSFTIVFWFVAIENFSYFLTPLLIFGLIATIGTLVLTFTKIKTGFYSSVFFYGWFLAMSLFIGIMQAAYVLANPSLSVFDAFILGMFFLYLIAHYLYFFTIFSIPRNPSGPLSISGYIRAWKRNVQCFTDKYSNLQISLPVALLIIVGEVGAFILNYYYNFAPFYLIAAVIMLLVPQSVPTLMNLSKKR